MPRGKSCDVQRKKTDDEPPQQPPEETGGTDENPTRIESEEPLRLRPCGGGDG